MFHTLTPKTRLFTKHVTFTQCHITLLLGYTAKNRRKNIYHDRLDRGLYPNPNTVEPYPADPKIRKKKKAHGK